MPITELVIPSLKQDDETREGYTSVIRPGLSSILKSAPGFKQHEFGKIIIDNGLDVSSDFRPVVGICLFPSLFTGRHI